MVKEWSEAEVIVEVQDNLNTHNASSFYENLSAAEARELTKRIEFHFTPKKGSWLNMAEMELSALARQCLSRRIPEIETLSRQARISCQRTKQIGNQIQMAIYD